MYKAKVDGSLTNESASLVLGRGNDVGQKINKDYLNKINKIPFKLNIDMVDLLSDTLKAPDKPMDFFELQERKRGFLQRDKETDVVVDYLLDNDNMFWFMNKYDKRGRIYSQGYHINPQGNAYRKAILEFHTEEELTTDGIKWLKMDIANCYGYDKERWFKRLTKANQLIRGIFLDKTTWKEQAMAYSKNADAPELFLKAIYAYHKGVIKGLPIGHDMGLDATASGLQIMSTISGDLIGARNSNVCPKIERTLTDEASAVIAELEAELASL